MTNTTYLQNGIDRRMKQMRTYTPQISNYAMLKIALKRETALTLRDWIRMQHLLTNRLYVRICIKLFEPDAPYYREVNLTPTKHNPMGTKVV